jgi:hypothetical protein
MDVVSFFGFWAFTTLGTGGGGQPPTPQAGAEAGIIMGSGAATAPANVSAHTTPADATATRMKPRIANFLTIPLILLSKHSLYLSNSKVMVCARNAYYFLTLTGIGGGGAIGTPQTGFILM